MREKIHGRPPASSPRDQLDVGHFLSCRTAAASASRFMTPLRVVNCGAVAHRVDHQYFTPAMTGHRSSYNTWGFPKRTSCGRPQRHRHFTRALAAAGVLPLRNRYAAVGVGDCGTAVAIDGRARRPALGRPLNVHAAVGSTAERRRCLVAVIPRRLRRCRRRVDHLLRIRPIRRRPWGTGWQGLPSTKRRKRSLKGVQGPISKQLRADRCNGRTNTLETSSTTSISGQFGDLLRNETAHRAQWLLERQA
jgi:hypothetical protein